MYKKIKTLAQVFSCEFFEISKNTFSYRTPPVAAPGIHKNKDFSFQTSKLLGSRRKAYILDVIGNILFWECSGEVLIWEKQTASLRYLRESRLALVILEELSNQSVT